MSVIEKVPSLNEFMGLVSVEAIILFLTLLVLIRHLKQLKRQAEAARESTERSERQQRNAFSLQSLETGRNHRIELTDTKWESLYCKSATKFKVRTISLDEYRGSLGGDDGGSDASSKSETNLGLCRQESERSLEFVVKESMSHWEHLSVGVLSGALSQTIIDRGVGTRAKQSWERTAQIIRHRKRFVAPRIWDQFDRLIDLILELDSMQYVLDYDVVRKCQSRYLPPEVAVSVRKLILDGGLGRCSPTQNFQRLLRRTFLLITRLFGVRPQLRFSNKSSFSAALAQHGLQESELILAELAGRPRFYIGETLEQVALKDIEELLKSSYKYTNGGYPPESSLKTITKTEDRPKDSLGVSAEKSEQLIKSWLEKKHALHGKYKENYREFVAWSANTRRRSLLAYVRLVRFNEHVDKALYDSLRSDRGMAIKLLSADKDTSEWVSSKKNKKEEMSEDEIAEKVNKVLDRSMLVTLMVRQHTSPGDYRSIGRLVFRRAIRAAREDGSDKGKHCILSVVGCGNATEDIAVDETKFGTKSLNDALRTYYKEGGLYLGSYCGTVSKASMDVFFF